MSPTLPPWQANLLLLLGAVLWGTTFVPQRMAAEHLGPFAFNAARFALGALVVLPLALVKRPSIGGEMRVGWWTGLALMTASAFQQAGLSGESHTTAGNAGFITGMYVVFVPFVARAFGKKTGGSIWAGAFLALVGLYFLSIPEEGMAGVNRGDLLILAGSACWTWQIMTLDRNSPGRDPFKISCWQNAFCAATSLVVSLVVETTHSSSLHAAWYPILYAGVLSAGVAFTLQVIAQRSAPPASAAVIMSLEAVFAALAGMWFLSEVMTPRAWMGAALMLGGMLLAQGEAFARKTRPPALDGGT